MSEVATQKAPEKKPSAAATLSMAILERRDAFAKVATTNLPPDRLVKLAQVVVARVPELAGCTTLSVLDALMTCARLGLEPNEPGGVWLVPFAKQCTAIVDYRGMVDVARRSGEIAAVHADLRYEHDEWQYYLDTTSPTLITLKHRPAEAGKRGEVIGVYCVVRLKNVECHASYLTLEQIERYRNRSPASKSNKSPWNRDWDAMAKKTAVRRVVNLLPRTPEIQALREAIAAEDQFDSEHSQTGEEMVPVIPMPRRKSDVAVVATDEPVEMDAAAPAAEEPVAPAEEAVEATRAGVTIKQMTVKDAKQGTVEVVDDQGEVYTVSDVDLVKYLEVAKQKGYRLQLTVDAKGTIVETVRL